MLRSKRVPKPNISEHDFTLEAIRNINWVFRDQNRVYVTWCVNNFEYLNCRCNCLSNVWSIGICLACTKRTKKHCKNSDEDVLAWETRIIEHENCAEIEQNGKWHILHKHGVAKSDGANMTCSFGLIERSLHKFSKIVQNLLPHPKTGNCSVIRNTIVSEKICFLRFFIREIILLIDLSLNCTSKSH